VLAEKTRASAPHSLFAIIKFNNLLLGHILLSSAERLRIAPQFFWIEGDG